MTILFEEDDYQKKKKLYLSDIENIKTKANLEGFSKKYNNPYLIFKCLNDWINKLSVEELKILLKEKINNDEKFYREYFSEENVKAMNRRDAQH